MHSGEDSWGNMVVCVCEGILPLENKTNNQRRCSCRHLSVGRWAAPKHPEQRGSFNYGLLSRDCPSNLGAGEPTKIGIQRFPAIFTLSFHRAYHGHKGAIVTGIPHRLVRVQYLSRSEISHIQTHVHTIALSRNTKV